MAYKFQSKELAKLAARVRGTGKPKSKTTVKRAAPRRRAVPRQKTKTTVKRAAPLRRAVPRKKTQAEIHDMRVKQGKRLAALRKRQLKGGR